MVNLSNDIMMFIMMEWAEPSYFQWFRIVIMMGKRVSITFFTIFSLQFTAFYSAVYNHVCLSFYLVFRLCLPSATLESSITRGHLALHTPIGEAIQ